jgi:prolyl-tRNA editing enzyme YbaK/EbsC (Cys-tRNA(Pro) deacylase)
MSIERVRAYLAPFGMDEKILEFDTSSATVELAAQALGVAPQRIAKTMSFEHADGCILVVAAGDARVDNHKFKAEFGCKARMLRAQDVEARVGHAVGGVCPFGVREDVRIYLDVSLKRFETVFPACGSANSAVEVTPQQLETLCPSATWVDVCKLASVPEN